MGYLLNPNTGKQVTWYEELAAIGSGSYAAFMLSCEEYTRKVIGSKMIDQTPPFRFSLKVVAGLTALLIGIIFAYRKFKSNKRKR